MTISNTDALQRTIEHREIFHDEMLKVVRLIMSGELSPVMTAALITGLRVKKETIGEITAAAEVMREFSTKVHIARWSPDLIGDRNTQVLVSWLAQAAEETSRGVSNGSPA